MSQPVYSEFVADHLVLVGRHRADVGDISEKDV